MVEGKGVGKVRLPPRHRSVREHNIGGRVSEEGRSSVRSEPHDFKTDPALALERACVSPAVRTDGL